MASARFISGIDKARLRTVLALFFVALGVPTAVLVYQAYGQLRGEAFYQQRVLAEELAHRVDAQLRSLMAVEEARSLADYRFLILQGDARTNFLQRSPLSNFPVDAAIPGLLSYFQIDANGAFSTPLLPVGVDPTTFGVSAADAAQRRCTRAARPCAADACANRRGSERGASRATATNPTRCRRRRRSRRKSSAPTRTPRRRPYSIA